MGFQSGGQINRESKRAGIGRDTVAVPEQETYMKRLTRIVFAGAVALGLVFSAADARGHGGGGHHYGYQGGHYAGGHGSSHRGGHYINHRTGNHYTHHY